MKEGYLRKQVPFFFMYLSIEFYGIKDGFSINVYLCRVVTFAIIEIFNNLIFIYYEKHVQKMQGRWCCSLACR